MFIVERRRSLRHEESDNRRQLMTEKYTRQRGSRRGHSPHSVLSDSSVFFTKATAIHIFGRGMHTLTAVPRSTPSDGKMSNNTNSDGSLCGL